MENGMNVSRMRLIYGQWYACCRKPWFWSNTSPQQRQEYAMWSFILTLTKRPNGKD